jgi:hypothetical protein
MKDTHRAGRSVVADDITDAKGRLVNVEVAVGLFRIGLGEAHGRLDRIDARLQRIERGSTPGKWHLQ